MKLKKLIEQINLGLENIVGVKFEGNEQYKNTIQCIVAPILEKTELGNLLKLESNQIKLVEKYESNCFGGGEELLSILIEYDKDKRSKYTTKGKFIKGKVIKHNYINDSLLEFELKDLQPYFNKINLQNNIIWYDKEIERKKQEILNLEEGRKNEIEKYNRITKEGRIK